MQLPPHPLATQAATSHYQPQLDPPPYVLPTTRLLRRVLHETAGVRQESLVRLGRMTRSGTLLHRASRDSAHSGAPSSPLARAGSVVWGALARPSRTVGGSQDQHLADGGELTAQQAAAAQLASRQASQVRPILLRDPRLFLSRGLSRLSGVRNRRLLPGRAAQREQAQREAAVAGLGALARMSAPPGGACPVPSASAAAGGGHDAV